MGESDVYKVLVTWLHENEVHIDSSCVEESHCHSIFLLVNPRHTCAARVTVLGLCVCVSVTQHLTFHVIIRATNNTTFLAADEGRKF